VSRTATRITRILAMLPWVIANPGATVEEVCKRFGYTKHRLLEDLDVVFVSGLPGYGPGDLMVAYVEDDTVVVDMADYFANSPRLNPSEGLALLAAAITVSESGQGDAVLESAISKLQGVLFPEGEEVLALRVKGESDTLGILRSAAKEGRVVEITYSNLSSEKTTVRSVEPWVVFASKGNWYLNGFCRLAQQERLFRVDRIREIRLLDQGFPPRQEQSIPEVSYVPSPDDIYADIELGPNAEWVLDYYPVEILEKDEERTLIRFFSPDPMVSARLLLRLGSDARLVNGEAVSSTLKKLTEEILDRYERTSA